MNIRSLPPLLLCAALLAPLSVAGEQRIYQHMKPVRFGNSLTQVHGTIGCDGVSPMCAFFAAQSFDDTNGVSNGFIWVHHYFASGFEQTIICSGPAYADILTYDERTYKFIINVTVDTIKDPTCSKSINDVVVVNLSGGPNGTFQDISTGRGVITTDESKTKYKVEHDIVQGTAIGTNGYFYGTYPVNIDAVRRTEKTRELGSEGPGVAAPRK